MSDQAIRTWKLVGRTQGTGFGNVPRIDVLEPERGPFTGHFNTVDVIELGPVLDLLKRAVGRLDYVTDQEILDLLREHGRPT